jgi:hypothetical protein
MRVLRAVAICAYLLCASAFAMATPRPVVVELFTSQGCSSCPPAEIILGELAGRRDVLALAYHVDYWDELGWRDPFSLAVATRRQQQYARALRLRGLFTPQAIIDGAVSLIGSRRGAVFDAVRTARSGPAISVLPTADGFDIAVAGPQATTPQDVVAVAYRTEAVTAVGRGENAGRTLREVNIVRAIRVLGTTATSGSLHVTKRGLPLDAARLAVLVQEPDTGRIVGATSVNLKPPADVIHPDDR